MEMKLESWKREMLSWGGVIVLTWPWPGLKGTVPLGLQLCPLWSGLKTRCLFASPLPFDCFNYHLKYLTKQGFPGLLNMMNLIMHLLSKFLARTLGGVCGHI